MTMRHARWLVAAVTFLTVAAAPALEMQAQGTNPVSDAIREQWEAAKRNLLGSAKTMPDDKFTFKPVDTVRSFGAILAHVAGANYVFCAAALGEKPPHAEDAFEKTAKTRAEIVKALQESYTYCDKAYTSLTDRGASESVDAPFGGGKTPRGGVLMANTGHLQEHYGNLVTYLRINGLVPPSSAPTR